MYPQGRGAESSTHSTGAPSSKPFVRQGENSGGVPAWVPPRLWPSALSPHGATTPWAAAHARGPRAEQGCTSTDKYPAVHELDQAPPECRHLNLQRNHLPVCEQCPKYSNNDKADIAPTPVQPKLLAPTISTALLRSWWNSAPEQLLRIID